MKPQDSLILSWDLKQPLNFNSLPRKVSTDRRYLLISEWTEFWEGSICQFKVSRAVLPWLQRCLHGSTWGFWVMIDYVSLPVGRRALPKFLPLCYSFPIKQGNKRWCSISYNYPLNPFHSSSLGHVHPLGLSFSGTCPKSPLSKTLSQVFSLFSFHSIYKFYCL